MVESDGCQRSDVDGQNWAKCGRILIRYSVFFFVKYIFKINHYSYIRFGLILLNIFFVIAAHLKLWIKSK